MAESANIDRKCERCGAPLGADAPEGLCPRCLMGLNLSAQTEVPGDEAGPAGTQRMAAKPEPPPPLEEIARQFPQLEILECLGRGGMGVVYKARQPRLGRFVALKILAREKERDPRFAERFAREAQALARLNHPNIVTVYDFGETNGLYYLLMEFVSGMSLRQLLQTRKLAPEEALTIVPSICEALQYAHQLGVVHRDIKPENILLDKAGRVKIADFGIAKLVGGEPLPASPAGGAAAPAGTAEGTLTQDQVLGTPNYMAPEQVEKPATVDHRADIFSLGVVFYEMLTGELPLGKFAPPSRMVKMDVRLDEVVLHALEKEPERRYQQASQVKTDVELIAMTEGGKSAPGQTPAGSRAGGADVESAWRQVKGPGTGLVVTAILNWVAIPLISLVGLAVIALKGPHHSTPLVLVPMAALVLSGLMLVAGLMMRRLAAYGLAIAGAVLAILVTPGNLIGLPIGIWALVVLSRREVRQAFGKGYPMPEQPRGGGAWKVAAVVVAGVMLLLAIPVGGMIFAIAIPNFVKARTRAKLAQQQTLAAQSLADEVKRGEEAWKSGDYDQALKLLRPASQQGDALAEYRLGVMYATGQGVERDFTEATRWFRKAAEQGQADAQYSLGLRYLNGEGVKRDYAEAVRWFRAAATQGQREAQYCLGLRYVLGQGVEQDYAEAARWFRAAAEQGHADAQFSLGMRYLAGQGVSQDDREAAHWFRQAADQGHRMAASVLAELYAKGRGVSQDLVEAYTWLAVAGDQIETKHVSITLDDLAKELTPDQLAEAQRRAKAFVPKPTPPPAEDPALDETVKRGSAAWASGDFRQALSLLLPAAIKGNPVAQHRLGVMYVLGQEVPQDYAEATRWLRKAAAQGQGESQYSMGLRYMWGQSVPQDDHEAARWFKLAADQGVAPAAAALKNHYARGEGVPQDLVEACKWGIVAGDQPDPTTTDLDVLELKAKLTPDQLAEAQRRAQAFVPKRTGPADP